MHVAFAQPTAIDYELLVSSLPGLYLVLAPDLTILNVSDAYLRSTSMVRGEVIGRRLFEVLPENPAITDSNSSNILKKSLQHVLNFQTAHTIPVLRYDIPRPKNLGGGFEERYWMTSNHPISDTHGKLQYIMHHVTDVTVQQMAHRQINTHRERYDLLAQAGADVIWDWDLLNNHIWWNEGFQQVFGYNIHDYSNIEDWVQKVHPDDKDSVIKGIYETEEIGGKVWTDSYRFQKADGTYAHVMERGYLLRDENGVAYRMVGSMFDISEYVKPSQKTKPNHDNYQKILDAMPNLAWCLKPGKDIKSGTSYINKAWQEYTGLSTDLLNGAASVMHAEDLVPATTRLTKSLQQQHNYEDEIRLKNQKTGTYRWFRSRAVPIRDEKGNVSLWFGTCTDINDQKETRTTAPREDHWKKILTEAPLNVAVFEGPDHICEFISPGFKKLLGNRRTEKMPLFAICPEADAQGFTSLLDTVFSTGKSTIQELSAILPETRKEESSSPDRFTFTFQPIPNAAGKTESIVVVATEIPVSQVSQKPEAETTTEAEILVEQPEPVTEKLPATLVPVSETTTPNLPDLEEFVNLAVEHLQKPIANLGAIFEELTRSATFTDPETEQLFALFRKNLQQAQGTLSSLPAFVTAAARPESGNGPVHFREIAAEVLAGLQEKTTKAQATITINFKALAVYFPASELKQAFQALLTNSLQYAVPDRKPAISISSETSEGFTVLTIQDNGSGIDLQKNAGKLFQPFSRFHKHLPGRGLSLYLLHHAVSKAGGRIEVESIPNEGTTFRIFFKNPVTRILLIDEDETAGFLSKRMLKRAEMAPEVTVKICPAEALSYLKTCCQNGNSCPDLILLDMQTAAANGSGFLTEFTQLKKANPELPEVILIATSAMTLDKENAAVYADYRVLPGPLDEALVQEIMQELTNA